MDFLDIPAPSATTPPTSQTKKICIIGAGAGGLAVLKSILETPQHKAGLWEVAAYEAREDVGGIWLPAPPPLPHPGATITNDKDLPLTPLYDSLTTNLPHPVMAFTSYAFPPSTPVFPAAHVVQTYLKDFSEHFNLRPYIHFNTSVHHVSRNSTNTHWIIKLSTDTDEEHIYDNVVVANGHYRAPRYPDAPGLAEWLRKRKAMHSVWYRRPVDVGAKVLVVGNGPSGRDISGEIATAPSTRVVIRSISGAKNEDDGNGTDAIVKIRGRVASYGPNDSVTFEDGTIEDNIDFVILATGYQLSFPFLSNDVLQQPQYPPPVPPIPRGLYNSTHHVFPLAKHLFPLTCSSGSSVTSTTGLSSYPPSSLAFVCLLMRVVPFPLMEAQAQAIIHVFTHPEALDETMEAVDIVSRYEDLLTEFRKAGGIGGEQGEQRYLAKNWHVRPDLAQFDYRDALHRFVAGDNGSSNINDDPNREEVRLVPTWVKEMYAKKDTLRKVWIELEREGVAEEWVKGVGEGKDKEEAEREWVDVLRRMTRYAEENGKDTEGSSSGGEVAKL